MKKKLILALALTACISCADTEAAEFSDLPEDSYVANAIKVLSNNGIINGVSEDKYEPERNVTRSEFSALVTRMMNYDKNEYRNVFTDVSSDSWYAGDVQTLYDKKIINGVSENEFAPNELITREQGAKILVGLYEKNYGELQTCASNMITAALDYQQISDWALNDMWKGQMLGFLPRIVTVNRSQFNSLIKGEYYVHPQQPLTRAETAEIIYNFTKAVKNIEKAIAE